MRLARVDFPSIKGMDLSEEQETLISRVENALRHLLNANGIESGVGTTTGFSNSAALGFKVPDEEFVQKTVIDKLRDMDVLENVEVYCEDENRQERRIYP